MRKLAAFSLSFAVAVGVCVYLLPRSYMPFIALFCALAGLAALFVKGDTKLRIILISSGLTAGALLTWGYGLIFRAPAEALNGQIIEVRAVVSDYPTTTDYGAQVQARVYIEDGRDYKSLIYLTGYDAELLPGDELTFIAAVKLADTFWNEETLYYASKGIMLKITPKTEPVVFRPDKLPIRYYPAVMCRMVRLKITAVFPQDIIGFMTALLTGERSGLTDSFYRSLKTSGIAHALVISGMHVAFLVGFIQLLVRRRRLAAVICVPIILFYIAMVGFTPSVIRAGFMQILMLLAPLLRRENDPPTSLSLVLLILLIINPYAISDVGLQLSFASMAGITLFSGSLYRYFIGTKAAKTLNTLLPLTKKDYNPIVNAVCSSIAATLGALVFTTPLTAIHFNTLSLVSPLTNLLCIWAVSLAFPAGLAACALGLIWTPLGIITGYITWLPAKYIITVVNLIAKVPYAAVSTAAYLTRAWFIYAYIAVFVFFLLKGRRKLVPVLCCAVTLVIVLLADSVQRDNLDFSFTAVDVGQGQSIVISSGGHNVIVDCGGTRDPAGAVADYLAGMNSRTVDYIILTHYHDDHAGDVAELMTLVNIRCVIMPDIDDEGSCKELIIEASELYGAELYLISEDSVLSVGSLNITIFAPIAGDGANERSLTVLASSGDYDLLITGDMDSETEKRLISEKSIPDIETLIVGHHGSKYSSCYDFLEAVRPETAIISVGSNSYGHPAEETIERLTSLGAVVYRCDMQGNITVSR